MSKTLFGAITCFAFAVYKIWRGEPFESYAAAMFIILVLGD